MFTIAYCCYANENYIELNLKNHYEYADKIIISYGPFHGYPQCRELMGLPAADNTLDIIKQFINTWDKDNKIRLIVTKDGFENFTDSRNTWLKCVDTEWFCSLDCDEFYYRKDMDRAKTIMREHINSGVNMIYCNRRSFALDRNHHYDNSWYPKLFANECVEMHEFIQEKEGSLQPPQVIRFRNGWAVVPSNALDLFSVVAYRNRPGMHWCKNNIDSLLCDGNGPLLGNSEDIIYAPEIRYNHYSACGNVREYFARCLYYSFVGKDADSWQDVKHEIEAEAERYKSVIENNPYALLAWFENSPGISFKKFTGEHPEIFSNVSEIQGEREHYPKADEVVDLDYEQRAKMHLIYSR